MTSAIMPTYTPADIAFEYGEGIYLFSSEGKKYIDFGSGIAVSSPLLPLWLSASAWLGCPCFVLLQTFVVV